MCLTSLSTCIKNCSIIVNLKEIKYYLLIQLLDKCLRGNKIASLRHSCLTLLGTCAKGVQFYGPSRTYLAILYCNIFSIFCPLCNTYDLAHASGQQQEMILILLFVIYCYRVISKGWAREILTV